MALEKGGGHRSLFLCHLLDQKINPEHNLQINQ